MAYALQISIVKKTEDGRRNFTTAVVTDEISRQVDAAFSIFSIAAALVDEPIDVTTQIIALFSAPNLADRLLDFASLDDLNPRIADAIVDLADEVEVKPGVIESAFAHLA